MKLLFAEISSNGAAIVWGILGSLTLVGLVAIAAPQVFRKLAGVSNRWVDSAKLIAYLDRRIDIDHHVLPFSRALGVAVLIAVGTIGVLYAKYLAP